MGREQNLELEPNENDEPIELDQEEKSFTYGVRESGRPVRIRPDGPNKKMA